MREHRPTQVAATISSPAKDEAGKDYSTLRKEPSTLNLNYVDEGEYGEVPLNVKIDESVKNVEEGAKTVEVTAKKMKYVKVLPMLEPVNKRESKLVVEASRKLVTPKTPLPPLPYQQATNTSTPSNAPTTSPMPPTKLLPPILAPTAPSSQQPQTSTFHLVHLHTFSVTQPIVLQL